MNRPLLVVALAIVLLVTMLAARPSAYHPSPVKLIPPEVVTANPVVSRDYLRATLGTEPTPVAPDEPAPHPTPVAPPHAPTLSPLQLRIRWSESRDNYAAKNTQSTASGAWQFLTSTWRSNSGLPGAARDYPPAVQDAVFLKVFAEQGTRPWLSSRSCWGSA